jgi:CDP-diacylglycerol--glycerol-3-phosphate 3-phosphatidyltransferase
MKLANKITIARICLIPVFGIFARQYGARVVRGRPAEYVRVIAAFVFILAAAMDGLDGFLARRFNQRSRLGAVLDPIADKGLVIMAIVVLALSNRSKGFPIWFPIAVIGRDAVLVIGFLALSKAIGRVEIRPSKIGKMATLLQIASILWLLLGIRRIDQFYLTTLATLFTVASGLGYVVDGIRQAREGGVIGRPLCRPRLHRLRLRLAASFNRRSDQSPSLAFRRKVLVISQLKRTQIPVTRCQSERSMTC